MDRLTSQQAGNPATAKWANEVVDELRRLKLVPGNGIRVTTTSSGTRIDIDIPAEVTSDTDPATDSCFPVFITGFVGSQAYTGVSYRVVGKTYRTSSANESAEPLYFPHVTPQTTIPIGCTILAHRIEAPIIQSSTDN